MSSRAPAVGPFAALGHDAEARVLQDRDARTWAVCPHEPRPSQADDWSAPHGR